MKRMSRLIVVAALSVAFLMSGIHMGKANAADYPQVSNLKAFSQEANYMSLPGYLRFIVSLQDGGTMMSRGEAVRIVKQQEGAG